MWQDAFANKVLFSIKRTSVSRERSASLAEKRSVVRIWNSKNVEQLAQKPVPTEAFQSRVLCSVSQDVSAKKDLSLTIMGAAFQEDIAKSAVQIWNSKNVGRRVQSFALIKVYQSRVLCSVFQGVSVKKDLSLTITETAYQENLATFHIAARIWTSENVEQLAQKLALIKASQSLALCRAFEVASARKDLFLMTMETVY